VARGVEGGRSLDSHASCGLPLASCVFSVGWVRRGVPGGGAVAGFHLLLPFAPVFSCLSRRGAFLRPHTPRHPAHIQEYITCRHFNMPARNRGFVFGRIARPRSPIPPHFPLGKAFATVNSFGPTQRRKHPRHTSTTPRATSRPSWNSQGQPTTTRRYYYRTLCSPLVLRLPLPRPHS
jgi:hypothetical protein